jgi:succinate--hydroxymethylglutarate CoA-transferase
MLPLEGLRVLSVEQYGAGPWGSQYLADIGAEVIKIENPGDGGDMSRAVGPFFLADGKGSSDSLFYQTFNRNKRSMTLNLATDDGKALFHSLVKTADAVTCNLRGDVPAKLGLTYDTLGEINPKIVCSFLTAYGRDSERAAWPGYDYLMQAETGYFSLTGEPGTPPTRFGLSIVDLMTGLAMAYATVSAVLSARATGTGRDIDVSLFDLALTNVSYPATWYLNADHVQGREPRSGHPSLVPCAQYKTKDGWIFLMCNKEKFWPGKGSAFPNFQGKTGEQGADSGNAGRSAFSAHDRRMAGGVWRPRARRPDLRRKASARQSLRGGTRHDPDADAKRRHQLSNDR